MVMVMVMVINSATPVPNLATCVHGGTIKAYGLGYG